MRVAVGIRPTRPPPRAPPSRVQPVADIAADIAAQAVEPVSVTADGQSVTARPLTEQITAQQFADQRAAGRKRRRGIASTILTTPGASGICSTGGFSNPGGY